MKIPDVAVREIPGLEGRYLAAEDGRIWSVARGKFRTQSKQKNGYMTITIRDHENGKTVTLAVHRLVASAWIPNPNNLPQVNHKDGDKGNPNSVNLEWCTWSGNMKHAWENSLQPLTERMRQCARNAGVASGKLTRKITEERLVDARRRVNEGEQQQVIAAEFGVSKSCLCQALSGNTYKSYKEI